MLPPHDPHAVGPRRLVRRASRLPALHRRPPLTPWIRWLCGGLEYQIEHHLFPDLPRHGLPMATPHVRAWCAERELPYEELGLAASWRRAIRFHTAPAAPPAPAAS